MDVAAIIAKSGGPVELARRLGVARTTVLDWRKAGLIPGSRVAQIATELDIPAQDLIAIAQPPRGQALAPSEAVADAHHRHQARQRTPQAPPIPLI